MTRKIVVLTGGVGGAKFVLGLCRVVAPESVVAIVNTGDDFRHFGLHVSPDIDTLLYTLSGRANKQQGWGREDETWSFMNAVRSLGGEGWFALGDGDLALHVLRTHRLEAGAKLSSVIASFAASWDIAAKISPMSDDPVATELETEEGVLDFQDYFVRRCCEPAIREIRYRGAADATATPGVTEAIQSASAIFIAPSNPWLSVAPILAVPPIRVAMETTRAPRIAISPIIGGDAVKGPTAKLMRELGLPVTNDSIVSFYRGLIDGLLIDRSDPRPDDIIAVEAEDILMRTVEDKKRVAAVALEFAKRLSAT